MNFASLMETRTLWKQIEEGWRDRHKPEGSRFLGNNNFSSNPTNSVESLLNFLANDLKRVGSVSFDRLNDRWGDFQNRNWIKIITFILSEYAYYNNIEGSFWSSLCSKLKIPNTQGIKKTFYDILNEGFDLLGVVQARGGYRYVSTLYLQSGIPQQSLPHFAELVGYVSNNLGWWNIAYRYNEIDLAQTLYDLASEKYSERRTLKRFLSISCPNDLYPQKQVEPLSGNFLKYIATVALELERRQKNPNILKNENLREQYLQGLSLPYNFFLRNWDNLASVLTPQQVSPTRASQVIRQRKRELRLHLDTSELNLQIVLPEQSLWRKEWRDLSNSFCQIPQAKWESNIDYPNSLEIPELWVNLNNLSESWTWQLKDANNCNLIEWHCEGVKNSFPLLIFDPETGDYISVNPDNIKITGLNELICYFPTHVTLQLNDDIKVTDSCFPCLIENWQAKQIRLKSKSATFNLIGENIFISVKWQAPTNRQPLVRGLQLKGKKATYLEVPQIYYPLGDSVEALRIQIEDMDRQTTITPPDQAIPVRHIDEAWQRVEINEWIKITGHYEVKLWQGNWSWSASIMIQPQCQISVNTNNQANTQQIQIQNSRHHEISAILPVVYNCNSDFWLEEISIKGLWPFEPIVFIFSGKDKNNKHTYSAQADRLGCLNLSIMPFRETVLDGNYYCLEWSRLGNLEKLIETLIEME
ncbi:hypothetical protein IQ225_18200 [Synechocystis salina LEGE 06155]|nr:hypothetical protein [Synechocystis salina LEGE 06155]